MSEHKGDVPEGGYGLVKLCSFEEDLEEALAQNAVIPDMDAAIEELLRDGRLSARFKDRRYYEESRICRIGPDRWLRYTRDHRSVILQNLLEGKHPRLSRAFGVFRRWPFRRPHYSEEAIRDVKEVRRLMASGYDPSEDPESKYYAGDEVLAAAGRRTRTQQECLDGISGDSDGTTEHQCLVTGEGWPWNTRYHIFRGKGFLSDLEGMVQFGEDLSGLDRAVAQLSLGCTPAGSSHKFGRDRRIREFGPGEHLVYSRRERIVVLIGIVRDEHPRRYCIRSALEGRPFRAKQEEFDRAEAEAYEMWLDHNIEKDTESETYRHGPPREFNGYYEYDLVEEEEFLDGRGRLYRIGEDMAWLDYLVICLMNGELPKEFRIGLREPKGDGERECYASRNGWHLIYRYEGSDLILCRLTEGDGKRPRIRCRRF